MARRLCSNLSFMLPRCMSHRPTQSLAGQGPPYTSDEAIDMEALGRNSSCATMARAAWR